MKNTYAVILAGGRGERFWPLSTSARPKQLLSLVGERTLLGMAVDRLDGLIPVERVLVLTNADLVEASREAVPELPPENVIGEPMGRDTAPAVALACVLVAARDPEAVFCILTADHVMGDLDLYRQTLRESLGYAADNDVLMTIGMAPDHPATGYGYIESGRTVEQAGEIAFHQATRFKEKPTLEKATAYLESGKYYWNSGMFIWSVESLRRAFAAHCPVLAELIDKLIPAVAASDFDEQLLVAFEPLEKISVDYALMEHAENIVMAEGRFAWDDVGSWPALENHFSKDEAGNVVVGNTATLDASGNIFYSKQGDHLTAVIGLDHLIVVQAEGVTMICPRNRAQDIKRLLAEVKANAVNARRV